MVAMALMIAWLAQSPAQAQAQKDDDKPAFDWSHIDFNAPPKKAAIPFIDAPHPSDPLYEWAQAQNAGKLPPVVARDSCTRCHTNPSQKAAVDAASAERPAFLAHHGGRATRAAPTAPTATRAGSPSSPRAEPNWNVPCNTNCHKSAADLSPSITIIFPSSPGTRIKITPPSWPGSTRRTRPSSPLGRHPAAFPSPSPSRSSKPARPQGLPLRPSPPESSWIRRSPTAAPANSSTAASRRSPR